MKRDLKNFRLVIKKTKHQKHRDNGIYIKNLKNKKGWIDSKLTKSVANEELFNCLMANEDLYLIHQTPWSFQMNSHNLKCIQNQTKYMKSVYERDYISHAHDWFPRFFF